MRDSGITYSRHKFRNSIICFNESSQRFLKLERGGNLNNEIVKEFKQNLQSVVTQLSTFSQQIECGNIVINEKNELQNTKHNSYKHNPIVILIEDEEILRKAWKCFAQGLTIIDFENPESCLSAIENGQVKLADVACILTDMYFDSKSEMDGFEFNAQLKKITKTPVVLLTSHKCQHESRYEDFYAVHEKDKAIGPANFRLWLDETLL